MRRLAFYILMCAVGTRAWASNSYSLHADVFLFGDNRSLNQANFSDYTDLGDAAGVLGVDFAATHNAFRIEIRPEIRALWSEGVGLPPTDPAYMTIKSPPRFMQIGGEISKTQTEQVYFDFEKLNISAHTTHLEFAVGRRPLGLGVLKYLPVWNKFTVVLPTQAGPPLIYNPDTAVLRYQDVHFAGSALAIGGATREDLVELGQLNYFGDWIEIQTLFGQWWNHAVAGLAFSKDIEGLTVRGETLWVGLRPTDAEHLFQGGLGLEYAFGEKFSAVVEGLYLQNGALNVDDYALIPTSRFSPFRAAGYALVQGEYKFTPDWKISTGPLVNIVDGSVLYLAELKWSVTNSIDITAQAKVPLGPAQTEFSPETFRFPDGSYIGYPYVFNLFLKAYF